MDELHIDSIRKSFGLNQVLTDIFITCKPGDRIGLIGRNGSGKSTFLKIIAGSLSADNKFIKVNGQHVTSLAESQRKISYLPQNNFLPTHLKVNRAIDLFCKSEIDALKNNPRVKPFLKRKSKELSGGERRMIEILLIIHAGAQYILIDEPFNGVEPIYKEDIKNLIKEHSRERGFIITDHDYKSVSAITTKTILLHEGSIKEIRTEAELIKWGYLPEFR
jgi:ABC-type multidrug transport system ATPase subunit